MRKSHSFLKYAKDMEIPIYNIKRSQAKFLRSFFIPYWEYKLFAGYYHASLCQ